MNAGFIHIYRSHAGTLSRKRTLGKGFIARVKLHKGACDTYAPVNHVYRYQVMGTGSATGDSASKPKIQVGTSFNELYTQ